MRRSNFDEVLSNLIHNAVKYSYRGMKIKIDYKRTGAYLILDVISLGFGIALEEHEKIFALGYRTADASRTEYSAVGVGLYSARNAASQAKATLFLQGSASTDIVSGGKPVFRNTFRLRSKRKLS